MNVIKLGLICVCFLQTCLFSNDLGQNETTIEILKGNEILPYLPKLAELRISFFRHYPYLYDGNLKREEERALSMYAHSENSIFGVAKEGNEIVGLIAGLPLLDSLDLHKSPWIMQGNPNVFYLGEIVFSEEHQTTNLQEKLYQSFEHAVKAMGMYEGIVVCEIEREESLKKSDDPFSSEVLWDHRGYIRHPEIFGHFSWKEVEAPEESDHLLFYWEKSL